MDGKGEGRALEGQAPAHELQEASARRRRLRFTGAADAGSTALQPAQELLEGVPAYSSLQMTMDLYGHLWSDEEADEALALASESLIPDGRAVG